MHPNTALVVLWLLLPAYLHAQDVASSKSGPGTPETFSGVSQQGQTAISVESLLGSKVFDRNSKDVGTIKSIMVDLRSGKLVRADIALQGRGFLGVKSGEQRISVPWEQLSVKRHEGQLVAIMTQEVVEPIKPEQTKEATDRSSKEQERSSTAKPGGDPLTPPPASTKQQSTAAGQDQQLTADEIRKAEEALHQKGLDPGPVDGKLDSQTQTALREFQKQNNLTVTGSLDRQTAEKLGINLSTGSGSTEQVGKESAIPESKSSSLKQNK